MWTVFGSFDIIFNVMIEFVFGRQFNNSVEDRLEGIRVERWHQLGGDWHMEVGGEVPLKYSVLVERLVKGFESHRFGMTRKG